MTDSALAVPLHVAVRLADPEAPRVVLVHGSMDSSASFRALDALLPDVTVERYDRRGYGLSRVPGVPGVPLIRHVDDLIHVLGGRSAVVLGHSLGGAVTLAAAVRAPELVTAALVYEVPMPWLGWWPPFTAPGAGAEDGEVTCAAELFLRRHLGDERWAALPALTRDELLAPAPALAAELRSAADRPPFEPGDVQVPVVSAYGTASDERHVRSATLLAEQIPGARLARIPGADHRAHRRRPAELANLLRSLLPSATPNGDF